MQISLDRSGGFAGLRVHTTVDTDELPTLEADPLKEKINQINFFELPGLIPPNAKEVDTFYYRLTVQDGERQHTIEMSGSNVPDELQPLLHDLIMLARSSRG